jgi:long-chain acyl-CoA synthetase
MPNLADLLTRAAERFGDRIALKLDDQEVNYAFLDEGASRIAGLLKAKGFEPGDRAGIMLPNVPYFAVVYYGILRAGGVVVPMNVLLKGREVGFYLEDRARSSCSPGTASATPRARAPRRPAPS